MATVPSRNDDQVKVTGAKLKDVVEHRENMDGGVGKAEHEDGGGPRVNDHGITERDHVSQSPQRVIRQDVKKAGGSPGLAGPEKSGGLLFPTGDAD